MTVFILAAHTVYDVLLGGRTIVDVMVLAFAKEADGVGVRTWRQGRFVPLCLRF